MKSNVIPQLCSYASLVFWFLVHRIPEMLTCACAPRQHTAVHKNSPTTLFSSSLCPNAVCTDTVSNNISGKTDDLLSNAELHKNKTSQKKNTEKESWIGYQLCCRVQRPPRTCREPVCFTAHAGGKQRHLVVKLASVFGSLRVILLEKTSTQSTSLLSSLWVFAMPRVTSSRLQRRWIIWWQRQRRGGDGSSQRPRPPRGSPSNGRR